MLNKLLQEKYKILKTKGDIIDLYMVMLSDAQREEDQAASDEIMMLIERELKPLLRLADEKISTLNKQIENETLKSIK